jgi:threonine dehydrogenase-like Zn-dependent dehydrogenase
MRREITVRGSYMYQRDVPHDVLMHVADGALSLGRLDVETFGLHSVAAAVSTAADRSGPHYVSVNPQFKE